MEKLNNNYWFVIGGIGLIVLEIILGAATGFDLLLIGIIMVIAGFLGGFFNSLITALLTIVILTFFYIFFGRKFIKEKLSIETKATNVDSIIGKKAMVIKKIRLHKPGQVKIAGEVWLAEAEEEIIEGVEVVIQSVSGVTLRVTRLKSS